MAYAARPSNGSGLIYCNTNRQQFVTIDGVDSPQKHMQFGVPQGSILGPLLFIVYINDIPEVSKICRWVIFADDANIIITCDNLQDVRRTAAELRNRLVHWVNTNGLKLNLKKTTYMLFNPHRNIESSNFELTISNKNAPTELVFWKL